MKKSTKVNVFIVTATVVSDPDSLVIVGTYSTVKKALRAADKYAGTEHFLRFRSNVWDKNTITSNTITNETINIHQSKVKL